MDTQDPSVIIETTLDDLDTARSKAEAFIQDIVKAFESGNLPEAQFLYMRDRVERFLKKISLYEGVFTSIKDAYSAVR